MPKHTDVAVDHIPPCDFDPSHGPAFADARIPGAGWANVCQRCFNHYGCSLGLGSGQILTEKS